MLSIVKNTIADDIDNDSFFAGAVEFCNHEDYCATEFANCYGDDLDVPTTCGITFEAARDGFTVHTVMSEAAETDVISCLANIEATENWEEYFECLDEVNTVVN